MTLSQLSNWAFGAWRVVWGVGAAGQGHWVQCLGSMEGSGVWGGLAALIKQ